MKSLRQTLFVWVRDRSPIRLRGRVKVSADMWLNPAPPLLVYQMGKVGSSAVCVSLEAARIPHSVFNIHYLSHDGLDEARRMHLASARADLPRHLKVSAVLRRRLDEGFKTPWLVVTLVREPISRTISDLFQNMRAFNPDLLRPDETVDVERTLDHLTSHFSRFDESSDWMCGWYDRELSAALDIDYFAEAFDRDRGWSVASCRTASILTLRSEDMDRTFSPGAAALLGRDAPLRLLRVNPTSAKPWARAYREVCERFRLPTEHCERIYLSRFVRHFYDDSMRRRFVARWSKSE